MICTGKHVSQPQAVNRSLSVDKILKVGAKPQSFAKDNIQRDQVWVLLTSTSSIPRFGPHRLHLFDIWSSGAVVCFM